MKGPLHISTLSTLLLQLLILCTSDTGNAYARSPTNIGGNCYEKNNNNDSNNNNVINNYDWLLMTDDDNDDLYNDKHRDDSRSNAQHHSNRLHNDAKQVEESLQCSQQHRHQEEQFYSTSSSSSDDDDGDDIVEHDHSGKVVHSLSHYDDNDYNTDNNISKRKTRHHHSHKSRSRIKKNDKREYGSLVDFNNNDDNVNTGVLTTATTMKFNLESKALKTYNSRRDDNDNNNSRYTRASPWVRHFLSRVHHDSLLLVPREFWQDHFNLAQLPPVIESIAKRALASMSNSVIDDDDNLHLDDLSKAAISPSLLKNDSDSKKQTKKQLQYPHFYAALDLITREENESSNDNFANIPFYLQKAATALYLLVHQRYILSPRGLDVLRKQFTTSKNSNNRSSSKPAYGRCPSLACHGMPLLPYGTYSDYTTGYNINNNDNIIIDFDDDYNHNDNDQSTIMSRAQRYCASCRQVYHSWESRVDGCAWGPSVAPLLLMTYPDLFQEYFQNNNNNRALLPSSFEPQIFGFRIHPSSRQACLEHK